MLLGVFLQAVYFLYGTKDCLVQECKDLDKRIEVKVLSYSFFCFGCHMIKTLIVLYNTT